MEDNQITQINEPIEINQPINETVNEPPVKLMKIQRKKKQKTEAQMQSFMQKCLTARKKKIIERYENKLNSSKKGVIDTPTPISTPIQEPVKPPIDDDNDLKNYLLYDDDRDYQPVRYKKETPNGSSYLNIVIPRANRTYSKPTLRTYNFIDDDDIKIYK